MFFIFLDRLEDVENASFIVVVSITFEPGLIASPGDNNEIDFYAFFHVNFYVVFLGVDVIDDGWDFDFAILEAVFNNVDFTDFLF